MTTIDVALDRPLPQSPEAERAVIGSCLTNPKNYWRVTTVLTDRDFFKDQHRWIWKAITAICEEGGTDCDTLTVKHELSNMNALDLAGGSAYISSLVDGIPDISNVEKYAALVKEKSRRRKIIVMCNDGMRRALDATSESAADLASIVGSSLQGLAVDDDRQSRSIYEVIRTVNLRADERAAAGRTRAVLTGFKTLDYHRVLRRKALTVMAAPSSHGKSTMMLNMATGVVENDAATRASLFSLEMGDEDVSEPLLSMISRVPLNLIQDRKLLSDDQQVRLASALDWLRDNRSRLFFADKLRDIDSLYADCRKQKATMGLDAIFVDYLQLVKGFDERTREQDVDRIGRALFQISQDLDIAVATGSQVNKDREKRANGRLSLRDMKYGEVIGNHARIACMWQCPRQDDKANAEIPWCDVIFQMEKNSGRETGDVLMHVDFRTQTFAEGNCESNNCSRAKKVESTGSLFRG